MMQRRDNKGANQSDNRRNRLFGTQERASHTPVAAAAPAPQQSSHPAAAPRPQAGAAPTIGSTMTIKGDVIGKEAVTVRGKIEGSVVVKENNVVIDESGLVEGSVVAKHALIRGRVNGEVQGFEKVSIAATGMVEGTIAAPKVVLEEGGKFKGMIDMPLDDKVQQAPAARPQNAPRPQELNPRARKNPEPAEAARP